MHRSIAQQRATRLFWSAMGSGLLVVSIIVLAWHVKYHEALPRTMFEACLVMMQQVWGTPPQLAAHIPFDGVLMLLLMASGAWAAWCTLAAWRRTRRLLLRSTPYGLGSCPALDTAVVTLPFIRQRLRTLDTPHPVACTVGLWQPQIILSSGLIAALSASELRAVIGHEWGHVSRHDPLRILVLRFWSNALWFLPIVRVLSQDSAHCMEEAADDAAVGLTDQPLDLAAALVKTAKEQAQPRWSPLPALGGEHAVSERVERLLEGAPIRRRQRHYRAWTASTVVAIFLLGLLLLPRHPDAMAASVPPLPTQSPMMACPMPLAQG